MTASPLVRDYLAELRSHAADRLDPVRSTELVDEIREHIEVAIDAGQPAADVLERLGRPSEIVAAEAPVLLTSPGPRSRLRAQEILAIVLVLIGAVVVGLGWIAGVVLLWLSDRWSTRDKLIGTLLWPGGLVAPLYIGLTGVGFSSDEVCDSVDGCTVVDSGGPPLWLGITLAVAVLVVPILTSIHLARSARLPTTP